MPVDRDLLPPIPYPPLPPPLHFSFVQKVNTGGGRGGLSVFATTPRVQPLFPPPSVTSTTPKVTVSGGGVAAGFNRFATVGGSANLMDGVAGSRTLLQPPPGSLQQQQQGDGSMSALSVSSSLPSAAAVTTAEPGGAGDEAVVVDALQQQQQQPWVAVGGSWRDEENVCGYWRFSEGAAIIDELEEGKQVQYTLRRGGFSLGRRVVRHVGRRWSTLVTGVTYWQQTTGGV